MSSPAEERSNKELAEELRAVANQLEAYAEKAIAEQQPLQVARGIEPGALRKTLRDAASALERLQKDYAMAEERCETWKAQAGRDQQENLVLKPKAVATHRITREQATILLEVVRELDRQRYLKSIGKFQHTAEDYARLENYSRVTDVLMEELGEVSRAINDDEGKERVAKELIEVAAVSVSALIGLGVVEGPDE